MSSDQVCELFVGIDQTVRKERVHENVVESKQNVCLYELKSNTRKETPAGDDDDNDQNQANGSSA